MPRIDVAVVYDDGRKEVVTVGRPADLIAFADKYDKLAPSEPYAIAELAWLLHRALKIEMPLDQWVDTLEDLTADDDAVAELRKSLAAGGNGATPDPSAAELERPPAATSSGGASPA